MSAGGGFTRSGIGTIVDMDSLEVEVDISEAYLQRVFPNQPAKVSLNAYPSHSYGAQVVAIVPTAESQQGDCTGAHRPVGEGSAGDAEHGSSGGVSKWSR